jgi:hypothetical protein
MHKRGLRGGAGLCHTGCIQWFGILPAYGFKQGFATSQKQGFE